MPGDLHIHNPNADRGDSKFSRTTKHNCEKGDYTQAIFLRHSPSERSEPVKLHIAPWALPNEPMPIHIGWEPQFDFQTATVGIPEGFDFVEFTNLDKVRLEGRKAIVDKSMVGKGGTSSYFGCVICCGRIPKETSFEGMVVVSFVHHEQVEFSRELLARIFRPQLAFIDAPETIELKDGGTVRSLPLHLRYTGFGDIQLRVEATIGGNIVSEGGSIAFEILRRLWLSEISEKEEDETAAKKKENLKVAPQYVKAIADEVQQIVATGQMPTDMLDRGVLEEIRAWLQDTRRKRAFMDVLYSRIEDMLLGMLVDLLESHPATNVRLVDPRAKISTQIRAPIEKLMLRLRYQDLLGNDYDPVEVPIRIIDRRTQAKPALDIPIVIEKWEDRPLLNVAGV